MSTLIARASMVEHHLGGLLSRDMKGSSNYYSSIKVSTPTGPINRAIRHSLTLLNGDMEM